MQLLDAGQNHSPYSKLLKKNVLGRVTGDCRPLDLQIWIRETIICVGQWKTRVYVNNLFSLQELKDNIHRETVNIPTQRALLSVKKYFLKMW